jgi:hypothetical protein
MPISQQTSVTFAHRWPDRIARSKNPEVAMTIKFGMERDVARFSEGLRFVPREQMPFAVSLALNRTAQDVKQALVSEIGRVFDRPNPFTLNSVRIRPATKRKLEVEIWLKDDMEGGIAPSHYLAPQVFGGERKLKRFERALLARRLLPPGMFVVPGAGAKLDSYGNISRGQIVQILSALGAAEMTAGYSANRTARSMKRRGALPEYFVGRPAGGKGPLGVWQRFSFAHGGAIKPIMIFVRKPTYRARLDVYGTIEEAAQRQFLGHLEHAAAEAMSTAR